MLFRSGVHLVIEHRKPVGIFAHLQSLFQGPQLYICWKSEFDPEQQSRSVAVLLQRLQEIYNQCRSGIFRESIYKQLLLNSL